MKDKKIILLKKLLSIPPNLQLYHWQTRSYPRHVATSNLYNSLIEKIDKFIEIFMGKFSRVRLRDRDSLPITNLSAKGAVAYIKNNIQFFSSIETFLPELKKSTDLLNVRDDIVGDLHQTLYLFRLK